MRFPTREEIRHLREEYPAGTKVELLKMEDIQAPPLGTIGEVYGVDDTGSLLVHWQNGSSLSVVFGIDEVRKVP